MPSFITLTRPLVPLFVLCWFGFTEYSYCYLFCKTKLYDKLHHHSTAIGLIVGVNVALLLMFYNWALIFMKGPGSLSVKVPPYNLNKYYSNGELHSKQLLDSDEPHIDETLTHFIEPPDFFQCDERGLPAWCPTCSTVKTLRSRHFSRSNKCIPKMDHYCGFIGGTIGHVNYINFFTFLSVCIIFFLICLISLFCYVGDIRDFSANNILHPAEILMAIGNGLALCMVTTLYVSTLHMLSINETTIDMLNSKRTRRLKSRLNKDAEMEKREELEKQIESQLRHFSVRHPVCKNIRVIVSLSQIEHPFDMGFAYNFKDWWNIPVFKTPQEVVEFENELIPDSYKDVIYKKIEEGEGVVFGAINVDPVPYRGAK